MATLLEIRDQVKQDLDLEEETFIEDSDLNRWINDAIADAESAIHTLYEDYFLSESVIPIISGQNIVDYPSDVYGNKIRRIIYSDSATNSINSHVVTRIKNLTHAIEQDLYNNDSSIPYLRWVPINQAGVGRKIRLFPEQGRAGDLRIMYIRNAARLALDTDVLDIDEYSRYIVQYTKTQAYLKDGDPRATDSKTLELSLRVDMVESLSDMTPNDENEVEADMSFYEDMVGDD